MTYDDLGMYIASDVRNAIQAHNDGAYDLVVTVKIRPGSEPSYETKLVKKRRPRRRKEKDDRQVEMFA